MLVLTCEERHLNLRLVDEKLKRKAFERQKGVCPKCSKIYKIEEMEADHIKPWHKGGHTSEQNCQMLCRDDNLRKSGK